MDNIFAKHERVALSFSGGKDSLALLYLLEPWWDKLTVYWMNPGNPFPETVALMEKIKAQVPHFKEIRGLQPEIVAMDGWPSDVVPHRYTTDGNAIFGPTPFKVQSRLQCCIRSLMLPTYKAMVADGITCCIRGKRREEADRTGLENGFVTPEGMELAFPLLDWSLWDVVQYLSDRGIDLPPSYNHASHSLDCMDCTAWWGEGLSHYLKAAHPHAFAEYERRVILIKQAVAEQMAECEV